MQVDFAKLFRFEFEKRTLFKFNFGINVTSKLPFYFEMCKNAKITLFCKKCLIFLFCKDDHLILDIFKLFEQYVIVFQGCFKFICNCCFVFYFRES